jgi:hypothetical protein
MGAIDDAVKAILDAYGVGVLIIVVVLFNLNKIGAGLERVASRFFPTWAEERKFKLEMRRDEARHEREARDTERGDTIIVLKETLIAMRQSLADQATEYKKSLSDANIERQRCQAELVRVVASYEKNNAAFLEAFRTESLILREQGRTLEKVLTKMEESF